MGSSWRHRVLLYIFDCFFSFLGEALQQTASAVAMITLVLLAGMAKTKLLVIHSIYKNKKVFLPKSDTWHDMISLSLSLRYDYQSPHDTQRIAVYESKASSLSPLFCCPKKTMSKVSWWIRLDGREEAGSAHTQHTHTHNGRWRWATLELESSFFCGSISLKSLAEATFLPFLSGVYAQMFENRTNCNCFELIWLEPILVGYFLGVCVCFEKKDEIRRCNN
jgi:hypothetical protein